MTPEFWRQRWADNQIGFHLDRENPSLVAWWPTLRVSPGTPVLVPLCGKSNDLGWLAQAGHPVVGVELSEVACTAFFRERQLVPAVDARGLLRRYRAGNVTLLEGDFFHLEPEAPIHAVYDRAAMIALPPPMREAYVRRLLRLMAPGAQLLLLTFDYTEEGRQGPPFAVPADEVLAAYGPHGAVELLAEQDVRAAEPARWGKASRAVEQVWRFVRGPT